MRFILIIIALFLSVQFIGKSGHSLQGAQKIKGLFLCETYQGYSTQEDEYSLKEVLKIMRNIAFVILGILFSFYLFKAVYGGIVPWNKMQEVAFGFLMVIFISIVLNAFIGGASYEKPDLYQDRRYASRMFERCKRKSVGAVFVPVKYLRKVKGD